MGTINLARLPEFLDKWGVRYETVGDWLSVGRASGGFEEVKGVVVHHTASNANGALSNTIHYALTGPDHPIANGCVSRDKDGPKFVLWAGLASNHAGKGGPRYSSRGVIPLNSANARCFGLECENNGVGERWSEAACDMYVRVAAAVIDWANECTPGVPLNAGDVFAHREWTPGRKIDPAGPSRFNSYGTGPWNMDAFRGEVWMALAGGPTPPPPDECGQPPTCAPGEVSQNVIELQTLLQADTWYPYRIDGSYGPRTSQGVQKLQRYLRDAGFDPGPLDGIYGTRTRGALCDYMANG